MKRIITLLAIICMYHITVYGQKKYEMVIEKTDGTTVVIKTEDIIRTYFRESENNNNNSEYAQAIIGKWDWIYVQGYYISSGPDTMQGFDLSEEEVFEFRADGTLQHYYYENHHLVEDGSGCTYRIEGNQLFTEHNGKASESYTIKELTGSKLVLSEYMIDGETGKETYREMIFSKL